MNKKIIEERVKHIERLAYYLEMASGMITDIRETVHSEIEISDEIRLYNLCDSLERSMNSVDKMYSWLHDEYLGYLAKKRDKK